LLIAFIASKFLASDNTCISAEKPKPPNIVFIMADDLGWTDLGCFGSDFYQTPHLDKLAAGGMRFTQNYSACNACSPTRGALMTGMYPARTHLTDWIPGWGRVADKKLKSPKWTKRLEHQHTTLAEALHENGYATFHLGKWHLGGPGWYPKDSGFDVNIGGSVRGLPPSYYYPYKGLAEQWDSRLTAAQRKDLYLTDRLGAEAAALVREAADKPFFMYLSFYAVHMPIEGRSDLVKKYQAATPGKRHHNPPYAGMVEAVDQAVGRVRAALEKAGVAERTLIVFTSDNGGVDRPHVTENAPLRGGKGQRWEGGIRVPAIVHWPGVTQPGSVCQEPVITMDYYPTILEVAGVEGNAEHNTNVDGLSLVNLLKEPRATLDRDALYWHYPHYNPFVGIPHSIIRAGDYKLIHYYEDDHVELYNLADDLGEEKDLAASQPAVVDRLSKRLQDHLKDVGARMPLLNPNYKP